MCRGVAVVQLVLTFERPDGLSLRVCSCLAMSHGLALLTVNPYLAMICHLLSCLNISRQSLTFARFATTALKLYHHYCHEMKKCYRPSSYIPHHRSSSPLFFLFRPTPQTPQLYSVRNILTIPFPTPSSPSCFILPHTPPQSPPPLHFLLMRKCQSIALHFDDPFICERKGRKKT